MTVPKRTNQFEPSNQLKRVTHDLRELQSQGVNIVFRSTPKELQVVLNASWGGLMFQPPKPANEYHIVIYKNMSLDSIIELIDEAKGNVSAYIEYVEKSANYEYLKEWVDAKHEL